jgi:hypothetical protein
MERIAQYRQAIRKLLSDRVVSTQDNSEPEIESQLIFDTEHDSPVGDATRTLSIIRHWLGRVSASLQLLYSSRYQGWQNLDSAEYDGSGSSARVGGDGCTKGRYCAGATAAL